MAKKKEEKEILPQEQVNEVKAAKEAKLPEEAVEGMEEHQEASKGKKKAKGEEVLVEEPTKPADVEVEEVEVEPEKEHKSVKPNVKKHPHGKKYMEVAKLIEKNKEYSLEEAIELLKKTATSKFDSSVEIHMNLNVDPSNADQQVRGSVAMPAGLGKTKRICAIVGPDKEKEAKDAGAENVGGQDLVEKIEKGWLDFEVVVATPDMMPHIGKIGKTLGTKGLMPNPKTGTVTPNVKQVIDEIKKGRAEYKIDKNGVIHASVGKVSFKEDALKENIETFLDAIHHAKPASVKGTFIKSVYLTTTMGPSVKLAEK